MAKIKTTILLLAISLNLFSQDFSYGYRVNFADKNNSAFSIENPEQYLSQKAIDRRTKYNIAISEEDLPVNPNYADSLEYYDAQLHNTSKWFNSALYFTNNANFKAQVEAISFVTDVTLVYNSTYKSTSVKNKFADKNQLSDFDYGEAANQINMCNAQVLHNAGYTGQGMLIAVIDAGFQNSDAVAAFDSAFQNNQVLGTYDFVENEESVYEDHYHGNNVWSIIAGNIPGQFLGSAPHADFWLLRSENAATEFPVEEDYWVFAAEFADSVGADLITTSLGYSTYDDPNMSWTIDDMDGQTTRITQGAEKAFSKGMFLANSAGNEGNNSWGKITAPSDAENTLCVGAVDSDRIKASFSSFGPSADGRVKPDVMAQGQGTALVEPSGFVYGGSGTSYSCPLMAGMVTCMWQAYPEMSNIELLNLLRESSDNFKNPNAEYGYGIPDFEYAMTLADMTNLSQYKESEIVSAYPNPFSNSLKVAFYTDKAQTVEVMLFNIIGTQVYAEKIYFDTTSLNWIDLPEIANYERGTYILSIKTNTKVLSQIVIKE